MRVDQDKRTKACTCSPNPGSHVGLLAVMLSLVFQPDRLAACLAFPPCLPACRRCRTVSVADPVRPEVEAGAYASPKSFPCAY